MIVDVLGVNVPPVFEIDKAVIEKPVSIVPASSRVFKNPSTKIYFNKGENLTIKRIIPRLPFQFGQGTGQAILHFEFIDSSFDTYTIPELSGNGLIYLPRLCEPLELNLFIKAPPVEKNYSLSLKNIIDMNVSMVNVPSDFSDEEKYKFDLFATIEHATELT